ncbi:MAG: SGNH/GDSL hydrolase family protein [Lachnospiraceae bacterium]|nr:SGNH/GDSL hydrolase family protein [Candidatus Equihabitans merdae]
MNENNKNSSTKYRIILCIVSFFLILTLLLHAFSVYCIKQARKDPSKVADEDFAYIDILNQPADTIDVIAIGDSESMSSINNMAIWKDTGITTYVSGEAGAVTAQCYYALKKAMENQTPDVVLLEANCLVQAEGKFTGKEKALDGILTYYFPGTHFHDVWKNEVPKDNVDRAYYKGMAIRPEIDPYTGGDYMIPTDEMAPMPIVERFYFNKIRKLCQANNVHLLAYFVPAPSIHRYAMHNTMQAEAEKYGFDYIDFSLIDKEIGLDYSTDILDGGDHVNLSGATKISNYLGKFMQEHYGLESQQGDPAYASWDQDYNSYEEEAKKSGCAAW